MKQVIYTSAAEKRPNALTGILKVTAGGLIGVVICTLMITGRSNVTHTFLGTVSITICAVVGCYWKNALATKAEFILLIPIAVFFPVAALISGMLISVARAVPLTTSNIIVIIKLIFNSLADAAMVIYSIAFYLAWVLGIVLSIVVASQHLKTETIVQYNCDQAEIEKQFGEFFKQSGEKADK